MRLICQREPVLSGDTGAWRGHSQRRGHWCGWLRVPPLGRRGLPQDPSDWRRPYWRRRRDRRQYVH
ncbi:hypothetical protein GBAR_LOCUS19662 [Geodia barretti]|uniref:Uncharacterized protein n=1 Tax=Geodia barretti TaxID=519541 RepID=A0AA35STF9_GEOBA|nr:hypothetical protein GBAR_LOCUS19662 [Geodia barretti]